MISGSCMKCDVIAQRIATPGGTIYADSCWHVSHIGPPTIYARGMLILSARRHVESMADLTEDEARSLGHVQSLVCRAVRQELGPERIYCCYFGEGTAHVHFSIVPRSAVMPAGSGAQTMYDLIEDQKYVCSEAEAEATAIALRAAIQRASNHVEL